MINKTSIIEKTVSFASRANKSLYKHAEIDDLAVRIWEKYATGDSEASLLEQSLYNEGITIEDIASKIQVLNVSDSCRDPENLWISSLDVIIERYSAAAKRTLQFDTTYSVARVCLLPFLRYYEEKIEALVHKYKTHFLEDAAISYSKLLFERLAFCADDTLLTCARCYVNSYDVPYWRTVPPTEESKHFIQWFYSDGFAQIINTYPLVLKKLILLAEIHVKNFDIFLSNYQNDINAISELLNTSPEKLKIANISGNLSDSHNLGQTVMRIEFLSGDRIYYKPRSVAVDIAWSTFIDKLRDEMFPTKLYVPKSIDRGSYGYMQEVKYSHVFSENELREYYRNAGGLCCIISMLGGSDFHHENIIAYGTIPVLVDVETIITPKPAPFYGLAEVNKSEGVSTHVGRTLMLQHWVGNSFTNSRDIGGFTSEDGSKQNIPTLLNDLRQGAEHFIGDFVSGFTAAYVFFENKKNLILRQKWLDIFSSCKFRYVFRRTALYYSLMKHFYSATFMRDEMYFEGAISRLGAGILLNFDKADAYKLWKLVLAEKESTRYGDIPYFWCYGNKKDLFAGHELCVSGFFDTTPVELATKNLLAMSHENMEKEIRFIELDLDTCYMQKQFPKDTPILSYQNIERFSSFESSNADLQLKKEIERIMNKISSFELSTDSFEYYAPVRNRKTTRYNVEVLPSDIYSGSLGVLITQAAFSKLSGDRTLEAAVLSKFHRLFSEEFHTGRNATTLNISYTQGVAGFVQTALVLSDILGDDTLNEMALNFVLDIPTEHLSRTFEHDFFSGLAGTLYYFSKLYKRIPNNALLTKIEIITQKLIEKAKHDQNGVLIWKSENEYQPLVGLAHGQSGIAIALAAASKLIGKDELVDIIQELFHYESLCYSQKRNNWFDFRKFSVKLREFSVGEIYHPRFMYGYCSGAPGIGISRIIASRQLKTSEYNQEINQAVRFCKKKQIIGNDSLCCGSSSWIDFLVEASLYFNSQDLIDCAKKICVGIIPQNSGKEYILSNLNGAADVSLFKGYAGIAYEFMRTLEPNQFPSVIV